MARFRQFDKKGIGQFRLHTKPAAKAAEPEYEINYSMQSNGVVRRYVIDYGDFTIIAELMRLEALTAPDCP